MADDKFPIGQFVLEPRLSEEARRAAIDDIAALPQRMREAVAGLSDPQLDTPYRAGGWTVRQLVHHVADSHANAYIRLKLALTEELPTITPYDQNAWARLPDSRLPVDVSLTFLDAVHARLAALLRSLDEAALDRAFVHPELDGPVTLDRLLQIYAWHSRHHVAHISALRSRERW
jgi:uncharacterized damage-inducible protein DinB